MNISSKFTTLLKYILSQDYRDYRFVRNLHIFDSEYYTFLLERDGVEIERNTGDDTIDMLWEYFKNIRKELVIENIIEDSWRQLHDPHLFFDTYFYLSRYGGYVGTRNPFAHYLRNGWRKGFLPSPLFDPDLYSKRSGWKESHGDPLTHYTHQGLKAGISPSAIFNVFWYLEKTLYSDVVKANVFRHYKCYGISEGKSLHPIFKLSMYIEQNKDQKTVSDDPLLHYLAVGESKGKPPNKCFDPSYYRQRYMEKSDVSSALGHYLKNRLPQNYVINRDIEELQEKPIISIIVSVFNPEPRFLNQYIRSVLYQTYSYWELCIVDDSSTDSQIRRIIENWSGEDDRIKHFFNDENRGISEASQKCVQLSSGDFLRFLDNEDELSRDCLYRIAKAINETGQEVFYTDEDLTSDVGLRHSVFHKPDFNKELLYSHNYITHFVVVSRQRYMGKSDVSSGFGHHLKNGLPQEFEINRNIEQLPEKPVISIIIPVFNPEPRFLIHCICSVLYQTYPYWELCIVDDSSTDSQIRRIIENWSGEDDRIKHFFNDENRGISEASQKCVQLSSGDFLGFLDNDDELSRDCLYHIAKAINETGQEVFYTDEDLISDVGLRHSVFHKPDFNKALLYSHNYITHFVVVSRQRFDQIGGLRSEFDGAQDYDLMLRLADTVDDIHHIPRVLYHWRALKTSTSIAHDQKPYAHEAGKKALQQSLMRNNLDAEAVDTSLNYHYRLKFNCDDEPSVTVIFCADLEEMSEHEWTKWLTERTEYKNYNCIILDDNLGLGKDTFNKAKDIQQLIDKSDDDFICLLGNGADGLTHSWLKELVTKFRLSNEIGIVCGRISYNGGDGPSYTVADTNNRNAAYFSSFISSASRHVQGLHNMQWVNSCDWEICLIFRQLIEEHGGFEFSNFPELMPMIDMSMRILKSGRKILYNPDAVITYNKFEFSISDNHEGHCSEKEDFQETHRLILQNFNSYYNVGILEEKGVTPEVFFSWLTGMIDNESLTKDLNSISTPTSLNNQDSKVRSIII